MRLIRYVCLCLIHVFCVYVFYMQEPVSYPPPPGALVQEFLLLHCSVSIEASSLSSVQTKLSLWCVLSLALSFIYYFKPFANFYVFTSESVWSTDKYLFLEILSIYIRQEIS